MEGLQLDDGAISAGFKGRGIFDGGGGGVGGEGGEEDCREMHSVSS